jgi:hypothetical protein
MKSRWAWVVGTLSSAVGACGIAGRAIMDTIGLANLPDDAGTALQAFTAFVLWLASMGPVSAYIVNGALLFVGISTLAYQRANALRAKHAEQFSDKAAFALALQAAADKEAPLIGELGNFIRGDVRLTYERALEFLWAVDKAITTTIGGEQYSLPTWGAIRDLLLVSALKGSTLRSLGSPSFPKHGTLYLMQHQLYDELERYNSVMAEIISHATCEYSELDFDSREYRSWLDADRNLRKKFVGIAARAEFTELCTLVRPTRGEKERLEWQEAIKKRVNTR